MKTQNDQLIWQPNACNVRGQLTNYLQGTSLVTQKYYDGYSFQTGDLTSATGGVRIPTMHTILTS